MDEVKYKKLRKEQIDLGERLYYCSNTKDGRKMRKELEKRFRRIDKELEGMQSALSCDVELSGLKDTATVMKYGVIITGGILGFYLMKKFNLFGGLKWLGDAFKDLKEAPVTIAKWEDEQIGVRVEQVDKILGVLKLKGDKDYSGLYNKWATLKERAVRAYGSLGYRKTYFEANKQYYFGSETSKERLIKEIDTFRTEALKELRLLQARKGFKLDSKWNIIEGLGICLPCLFI